MIHSTTERWNLFFSSPFFNSSLHTLELYIHNCIFMYTSRIYSYKSAPANIALWPTISSPFREANISIWKFLTILPFSLDSNTVVENILGQFLSNYESSKARILYIHIYTHIRIRLVIKERSISSGSIGRDDWPVASTTVDGFLPGDVLLPRIESRYRGNLGPVDRLASFHR